MQFIPTIMRLLHFLQYVCLLASSVQAQFPTTSTITSTSGFSISTSGVTEATLPTGSYVTYSSTITIPSSSRISLIGSMPNIATSMGSDNTTTAAPPSQTVLAGTNSNFLTTSAVNGTGVVSASATGSPTSSSVQPTNTTPCNGWAEFCNRKYSNITMVSAHNSPFNIPGNVASNQELSVTTQLNDGVRMLQAQAHKMNDIMYLCHTNCEILNAGTLTAYLTTIKTWVQAHPYDIVSILIGNGDYDEVTDYVSPIKDSGIDQFLFIPPKIPMALDDWPTLSSMILSGQRVVLFLDYDADQTQVPWILDEFSQMWETPFDPTDRSFPCTVQRPPVLSRADATNRLYLMNHNLNQEVSLLGNSLLIPLKPLLPITNDVGGFGSLGDAAQNCTGDWGRAPNFLNVDYYNNGSGTVFEVAAMLNGVTYNRTCCGMVTSMAERTIDVIKRGTIAMTAAMLSIMWLMI